MSLVILENIEVNFNDKLQHDAGKFMTSTFEHLFTETVLPNDIDEKIFGGIFQEKLTCTCGKSKLLPFQKLPEIWTIQIEGESIQSCIDIFLALKMLNFTVKDVDIRGPKNKLS